MKTIAEKAKAYDEIIERAKTMLAAGEVMYGKENNASQLITDLIPELRESEDERIYREIYSIVHHCYQDRTDNLVDPERKKEQLDKWEKAKDWLEKQKEQKPVGWSDEDKKMLAGVLDSLKRYQLSMPNYQVELQMRWLYSLRPSWKPSEEQMEALKKTAEGCIDNGSCRIIATLLEQLKKL